MYAIPTEINEASYINIISSNEDYLHQNYSVGQIVIMGQNKWKCIKRIDENTTGFVSPLDDLQGQYWLPVEILNEYRLFRHDSHFQTVWAADTAIDVLDGGLIVEMQTRTADTLYIGYIDGEETVVTISDATQTQTETKTDKHIIIDLSNFSGGISINIFIKAVDGKAKLGVVTLGKKIFLDTPIYPFDVSIDNDVVEKNNKFGVPSFVFKNSFLSFRFSTTIKRPLFNKTVNDLMVLSSNVSTFFQLEQDYSELYITGLLENSNISIKNCSELDISYSIKEAIDNSTDSAIAPISPRSKATSASINAGGENIIIVQLNSNFDNFITLNESDFTIDGSTNTIKSITTAADIIQIECDNIFTSDETNITLIYTNTNDAMLDDFSLSVLNNSEFLGFVEFDGVPTKDSYNRYMLTVPSTPFGPRWHVTGFLVEPVGYGDCLGVRFAENSTIGDTDPSLYTIEMEKDNGTKFTVVGNKQLRHGDFTTRITYTPYPDAYNNLSDGEHVTFRAWLRSS